MPNLQENDDAMREVLTHAKVIAVVGHSDKRDRTSYQIAQFLRQVGYTVYPVNPTVREIDGKPCYPSLQAVPEPIDIVNVFRRSEHLPAIVEEAISKATATLNASHAKTIWTQLGVTDDTAAQTALNAGLNIVMNACIKIEYLRLGIR
ncbi:MAG TPA: CoA-binding protein [Allocoleopsis sp.]